MTHVVASPIVSPHQSAILDEDDDAYFFNTDSSNKTPTNNKDAAATAAPADAAARADVTGKSPSYRKTASIKLYASPSLKIDDESPFHEQQLELQLDHDDDPNMQECEKVGCWALLASIASIVGGRQEPCYITEGLCSSPAHCSPLDPLLMTSVETCNLSFTDDSVALEAARTDDCSAVKLSYGGLLGNSAALEAAT
jgi:hypothetical protein